MTREGGCSCGAVRYALTRDPMIVHACHCRDCQRVSGSVFVIDLWIERKHVEATYKVDDAWTPESLQRLRSNVADPSHGQIGSSSANCPP
jgi:hypothetical protein